MAVRRLLVAGRYRLHEPVGTGGMGRVWMARDEMLDRDVAVKEFVPPAWMTDVERDRLRDRTLREARSAARLNHRHVVRIYDVVHFDDLPWIVMEYVPSRSLHQVIVEDGPLTPAETARIGLDVLDALTAAHRAGVLHRDVKPHNVLIGHDGRVVLTDFGLATFVDDGAVTGPGLVVGSPQYVSPERARHGASTVESDLWSFAATLYAAVEGRSPYARESAMATLTALATEQPDPPLLAGPLTPILTGLLRHDPAARLTADDAEDQLRQVLAGVQEAAALGGPVLGGPVWRQRTPAELRSPPGRPGVSAGRAPVPSQRSVSGDRPAADPAPRPHADVAEAPSTVEKENAAGRENAAAGSRYRLALAGVLAAALLGGGGLFVHWLSQGDGRSGALPGSGASPSTGPSGTTGGSAGGFSPIACAGPQSADLPRTPMPGARLTLPNNYALLPSWSYHSDPSGFFIAVPDGWTYQRVRDTLCFREPGGVRVISVDTARKPSADPVAACRAEATRLTGGNALPGYQEFGIDRVPFVAKAADWEYQYDSPAGDRLHATTRWFAAGPKAYALGWVTRESDWQTNRSNLTMIQASFTLA